MNNVLIVGASGFLGRAVAAHLDATCAVHGTYSSNPGPFATLPFNFWTQDIAALLKSTGAHTIIMAATIESIRSDPSADGSLFEQRARAFASSCADHRVVYMSTDAVFDGTQGNYRETDEPNPMTAYGRRSALFERVIRDQSQDHCIVRCSYLFDRPPGGMGGRLERTRQQLLAGESMEYFTDMFKSPMLVGEAARAIGALASCDHVGIIHISGARLSVFDHHTSEMSRLGLSIDGIKRAVIPMGGPHLRDTSLCIERIRNLV